MRDRSPRGRSHDSRGSASGTSSTSLSTRSVRDECVQGSFHLPLRPSLCSAQSRWYRLQGQSPSVSNMLLPRTRTPASTNSRTSLKRLRGDLWSAPSRHKQRCRRFAWSQENLASRKKVGKNTWQFLWWQHAEQENRPFLDLLLPYSRWVVRIHTKSRTAVFATILTEECSDNCSCGKENVLHPMPRWNHFTQCPRRCAGMQPTSSFFDFEASSTPFVHL